MKEKSAGYTSQKDFLSQCINRKLVPKGLELTLEPTIGNYNKSFIDNCYSKLIFFSLNLMKDLASFCGKTIKETKTKIDQTENILKQQLGKNEFEELQKTIKSSEASTKKILHQRKFRKFNNLKYKSKVQVKARTIEETGNTEKPTYAEILSKSLNPSKRQNLTTNLESKAKPNIHERLQSMSPTNKH